MGTDCPRATATEAVFAQAIDELRQRVADPMERVYAAHALLDAGDVRKDSSGNLVVTDPLLADWLRQRLPVP